jgi:heme/copper-type cytochrome/quinol oxidase subunit 2
MGLCAWVVVLFVCLFVFGLLGLGLAVFGEENKKKNPERKKNPPHRISVHGSTRIVRKAS